MKPKDMDTDDILDELRTVFERKAPYSDDEQASVRVLFRELDSRMKDDDCPSEWGGGEEGEDDGDEDE
jgi:hypothetical protein